MNRPAASIVFGIILLIALAGKWQVHSYGYHAADMSIFQSVDGWDSESSQGHLPDAGLVQRQSASEFRHHKQLEPAYELLVEFLAEDLSTKHFTYIRTIPDIQPWFEIAAFVPNKMRLSGWKDTRLLYRDPSNVLNAS